MRSCFLATRASHCFAVLDRVYEGGRAPAGFKISSEGEGKRGKSHTIKCDIAARSSRPSLKLRAGIAPKPLLLAGRKHA